MNGEGQGAVPPVLLRIVQIVSFLFAAFGGFLANIAPPEEASPGFAVGLASFLSLCVLLYIAAISKDLPPRKHKRRWLVAAGIAFAGSVGFAAWYSTLLLHHTFRYPSETSPERYVAGTEMTSAARDYAQANPGRSTTAIVKDFGGLERRESVWTASSIALATQLLTGAYVGLVVCFAATIFCLTEGVLSARGSAPPG